MDESNGKSENLEEEKVAKDTSEYVIKGKREEKAKWWSVVIINPCVILTFVAIGLMFLAHDTFLNVTTYAIFFVVALLLFFLGVPLFIDSFRRAVQSKKTRVLMLVSMLSVYLLCLLGLLPDVWPEFLFLSPAILLPAVASGLGIIAGIIFSRSKDLVMRLLGVRFIVFLVMILTMMAPELLNAGLPYIYLPPAITPENLAVYNECIKFVKNHPQHENLSFTKLYSVSIGNYSYPLKALLHDEKTKDFFSINDINEIMRLCQRLEGVGCPKLQRDSDILLFYKDANYILPVGLGVVYSLNGENPNKIDTEVLKAAKPFTKIAGNWHTSRGLMLRGHRSDVPYSMPKPLIDHSLRTEGLILGDVDE